VPAAEALGFVQSQAHLPVLPPDPPAASSGQEGSCTGRALSTPLMRFAAGHIADIWLCLGPDQQAPSNSMTRSAHVRDGIEELR